MDTNNRQELLVVNFFRTADGRLNCRIRDALTKEHWIVRDPRRLHGMLQKAAAAAVLAVSTLTGCAGGGRYVPAAPAWAADATSRPASATVAVSVALSASSMSPGSKSVKIVLASVNGKRVAAKLRKPAIDALTKCSKGCRVAGPESPAGNDRYSITIYDAASARGHALASATVTAKISAAKHVVRASLGKIPAYLAFGAAPALAAGTATTAALSFVAQDADRNAITGTFATPIALSDGDTSAPALGTSLSIDGAAAARSAALTNSAQTIAIHYGGLAIAPTTISASVAGAATADVQLAPSLGSVGYTGPLVSGSPEIDLYNPVQGTGPGYQASFSLSEPGWNDGTFSQSFTYATGGSANNCASFSIAPSSGNAFAVSVAPNPTAGACTLTMTGATASEKLAVKLTYTSSGVGVFLER
jgi:hypothetical protein